MKLAGFEEVRPLVQNRHAIKKTIEQMMTCADQVPNALNVMIAGNYQDDAMCALVQPLVVKELSGRIAAIDKKLKQLGVNVD